MRESFSLKELARGAGVSLIGGLAGYAFMFAFKVVAARHFGPEDFGMFTFADTLLGIFTTIALFGLNSGITRYIPFYEERGEASKLHGYLRFVYTYPLILSCLLALCRLPIVLYNRVFCIPRNLRHAA
jgi:O-antigen/teichoic acid export membrane protein